MREAGVRDPKEYGGYQMRSATPSVVTMIGKDRLPPRINSSETESDQRKTDLSGPASLRAPAP